MSLADRTIFSTQLSPKSQMGSKIVMMDTSCHLQVQVFDSFAWQRGLRFIWTEITTIWRNWFGKWQSLWGQFVKAYSQQICPYLQQNCLSPTSILAVTSRPVGSIFRHWFWNPRKIVVLWEPKVMTRLVWLEKNRSWCRFMFENISKLSSKVIDSGTLDKIVVLWEPKVLTRLVWLKKKQTMVYALKYCR